MSLDLKSLLEKWEYIQGGLLFLDETGACPEFSLLALGRGELRSFIASLTVTDLRGKELIDYLNLHEDPRPFEEIPVSLQYLLDQDLEWLKEEGGDFDTSYGSVTMALFYESVRQYLGYPSSKPGKMKEYVQKRLREVLPRKRVQW